MRFEDLKRPIHLYHGDVPIGRPDYDRITGLSLSYDDAKHIRHDIRDPLCMPACYVESIQSESVMEYIDWWEWPQIIKTSMWVLRQGGVFRLSVPDYRADVLRARCEYNKSGAVCYDPIGGVDVKWFPTVEPVFWLCSHACAGTGFVSLLHGIHESGEVTLRDIDYSRGYVKRTPDYDARAQNPRRVLSIVVDMLKL